MGSEESACLRDTSLGSVVMRWGGWGSSGKDKQPLSLRNMAAPALEATTAPSCWSPEIQHAPIAAQLSGKCPRPSLCPPTSPPPTLLHTLPRKINHIPLIFLPGLLWGDSFYWGYRTLCYIGPLYSGVELPLWHLSRDHVIRWTIWLGSKRQNRSVVQVKSQCPRWFSRFNELFAGVLTEPCRLTFRTDSYPYLTGFVVEIQASHTNKQATLCRLSVMSAVK